MKNQPKKLLTKHQNLIQTDNKKVMSHVQREQDEWFINTIMLEGYEVPFKYKRQKKYRDLTNSYVNLTYYPAVETVAECEFEVMKVVRIRRS